MSEGPAYVSADVPGIGGVIKQRPEDFLVDEQPAYAPSGEGEHIYLLVQKRGMSTMEMLRVIARHFGVPARAVGYAGLKDKHAITRQVVSVHAPGKKPEDFPMLAHERVSVLWADRHTNKLRPGHLRGNRFSIKVRNVQPTHVRAAWSVLRRLREVGSPNRIGTQRFGMLGNNHAIGRAIVLGAWDTAVQELLGPNAQRPDFNARARELFVQGKHREAIQEYPLQATIETRVLHQLALGKDARRALLSVDDTTLRFYLTAFQSYVFNRVLDQRVREGALATLRAGDLALKHENHAVFPVDEATLADATTAQRLERMEISPSGPMWASSMTRAGGEADAREVAALAELGLTPEQLLAFDQRSPRLALEGKRRPLRVPVIDPEVEGGVDEHGAYVRCAFELPRGAFATEVMREVMKPTADPLGEDAEDGAGG